MSASAIVAIGTGAAGLVVVVAGAAKAANHRPTRIAMRELGWNVPSQVVRAFGVAEVIGGALVFATMWWPFTLLAAIGYVGFAVIVWRLMYRATPCGCFGRSDVPPTWGHVGMNLAAAGFCVAATITRPDPPTSPVQFVATLAVTAVVVAAATKGATALGASPRGRRQVSRPSA